MAINHFDVLRRVGNDVESRGHFFIDSPLHRQDQLLAELTDKDRFVIGRSWVRLPSLAPDISPSISITQKQDSWYRKPLLKRHPDTFQS